MATPKKPTPNEPSGQLNREQRRREKFGRAGRVSQHDQIDPWPQSETNPALNTVAAGDQAAHTGTPDQDVTHQTGPGTGGATETADRIPEHEGQRPKKSAKG